VGDLLRPRRLGKHNRNLPGDQSLIIKTRLGITELVRWEGPLLSKVEKTSERFDAG